MKTTNLVCAPWLLATLAVCLLSLPACKKEPVPGPPQEYYGVKVDWLKLDSVFTNASAEVQNSVALVKRHYRYGLFPQALAELGRLAKFPNLTEEQKKLVSDLTEQTKQVIAKTPAPGR